MPDSLEEFRKKAGNATFEKRGRDHYVLMAKKRWERFYKKRELEEKEASENRPNI